MSAFMIYEPSLSGSSTRLYRVRRRAQCGDFEASSSRHQGHKNVHVLEADVADYRSLEVPYAPSGVVTTTDISHRALPKRQLRLLEGSSTV